MRGIGKRPFRTFMHGGAKKDNGIVERIEKYQSLYRISDLSHTHFGIDLDFALYGSEGYFIS